MEKKLSRNKSSYGELDGIAKIRNLLNPWTRWYSIRFLIAVFVDEENSNKLFDFRIIVSLFLFDLRESGKASNFVPNGSVLLILLFSIHRLGGENLIGRIKFHFHVAKIQQRIGVEKWSDERSCATNSHTKFEIHSRNSLSPEKVEIKSLLQRTVENPYFKGWPFPPHLSHRKTSSRNSFWWRGKVPNNIKNSDESDGIPVEYTYLPKDEGDVHPQSHVVSPVCQLYQDLSLDGGNDSDRGFVGNARENFKSLDDSNDPQPIPSTQTYLSNLAHTFSKHISSRLVKYDRMQKISGDLFWERNNPSLAGEDVVNKQKKHGFTDSNHSSGEISYYGIDPCLFEWVGERGRRFNPVTSCSIDWDTPSLATGQREYEEPMSFSRFHQSVWKEDVHKLMQNLFPKRIKSGILNILGSLRRAPPDTLPIDGIGMESDPARELPEGFADEEFVGKVYLRYPAQSDSTRFMESRGMHQRFINYFHSIPVNPASDSVGGNPILSGGSGASPKLFQPLFPALRKYRRRDALKNYESPRHPLRKGLHDSILSMNEPGPTPIAGARHEVIKKDIYANGTFGAVEISDTTGITRYSPSTSGGVGLRASCIDTETISTDPYDFIARDSSQNRNSQQSLKKGYLIHELYLHVSDGIHCIGEDLINGYCITWKNFSGTERLPDSRGNRYRNSITQMLNFISENKRLEILASRTNGHDKFLIVSGGVTKSRKKIRVNFQKLNRELADTDGSYSEKNSEDASQGFGYPIDWDRIAAIPTDEVDSSDSITKSFVPDKKNDSFIRIFSDTTIPNHDDALLSTTTFYGIKPLRTHFCEANTLKSIDFLHNPRSQYKNSFVSRSGGGSCRIYDSVYSQSLKNFDAYGDGSSFSINSIKPLFLERNSDSVVREEISGIFVSNNSDQFDGRNRSVSIRDCNGSEKSVDRPNPFLPTGVIYSLSGTSIRNCEGLRGYVNLSNSTEFVGFGDVSEPDREFYRILDSQKIDHLELFFPQSMNPSLSRNETEKDFVYVMGNGVTGNVGRGCNRLYGRDIHIPRPDSMKSTQQIRASNSSEGFIPCYKVWVFTLEWWEYTLSSVAEISRYKRSVLSDRFEYFAREGIRFRKRISDFSRGNERINKTNPKTGWVLRLLKEIEYSRMERIFEFSWLHPNLVGAGTAPQLILLGLLVLPHLIRRNHLSIAIGSDLFHSWNCFHLVQDLLDTSLGVYLNELVYRDEVQPIGVDNFPMSFFRNLMYRIKHFEFHLLAEGKIRNWLVSHKSLDLSRRRRRSLVQSLVAKERIAEYDLGRTSGTISSNDSSHYRTTQRRGLLYLQHLAHTLQRNLINRSNHHSHSAEKWIFSAFWQGIMSTQTRILGREGRDRKLHKIPAPLRFGLSPSKGILLIGPIGTGRSYPIKQFSADSYVPLPQISINKLLYNKPDVVTENWMNILIESLRRLNLTLELARKMSPCSIWIRNIHQLNINHLTQNVESDPTFLLGISLKYFRDNNRDGSNVIIIGSTDLPEKVDPALISPNRLDRVINIRILNISQRRRQLPILLHKDKLSLEKNVAYLYEFGCRTMGYNMRDLAALANEVLLISTARNQYAVCVDTLRLAFSRQIYGFTHADRNLRPDQIYGILLYGIGKVIARNIFVRGFATNPLDFGNSLWRKRFHHLSKSYSEASTRESSIREFTIYSHISGCLAGTAARDSRFSVEGKWDNSIPLDVSVGNDSHSVFSFFESLLTEFPWLEFRSEESVHYEKRFIPRFVTKNDKNPMRNGSLSVANQAAIYEQKRDNPRYASSKPHRSKGLGTEQLYGLMGNTAWSPINWRFSFLRSHLFDWIKRPNEFEFRYDSRLSRRKENHSIPVKDSRGEGYSGKLMDGRSEQRLYGRILPRIRRRNVQELESQFQQILLEEQFEILGFYQSSTHYRTGYQIPRRPRLCMGKRILWDPTCSVSQFRHFVPSHRDFFTDEEMLRRLYVTYGAKREGSRSRQRMKQFFIGRGYNKDLVTNLSIRWWNQLPIDKERNIDALKRIEQIGVQLKRPQVFAPVYSYQRWLIENSPEKFARFDVFSHRLRWLRVNDSLFNDAFVCETLLESYRYLSKFFISNKELLDRMMEILLGNGCLSQNGMEQFLHRTK